ncbi:Myc-type, basic helix-loop-helix, partial [Sesbania bispinosa]
MGHDKDLFQQCQSGDDDEFLRDILQQPALSAESESQAFTHNNTFTATVAGATVTTTTDGSSLSSDEIICSDFPGKKPRPSSAPRTYILSFDNSTIIPATPEPVGQSTGNRSSKSNSPLPSKKRLMENPNSEPKPRGNQGGKKSRSDSQIMDHILAERKRRQELTEKFIALSATIPGLKK